MPKKKKLKVLFVPLDAVGHVNAAVGIAQVLKRYGHSIGFVISQQWKGKLVKYGFEEIVVPQQNKDNSGDSAKHLADIFFKEGVIKSAPPLELLINLKKVFCKYWVPEIKQMDLLLEEVLKLVSPDVIFYDHIFAMPALERSGIPWVLTSSCNPNSYIQDGRTPPSCSGLPSHDFDGQWTEFTKELHKSCIKWWKSFNDYVVSRGLPPLKQCEFIRDSPFLNIYGLPLEIDYLDLRPLPKNWVRFDNLQRNEMQTEFKIPKDLMDKPGKLIYLSMGTMGGANVELMKRLVAILAESKHRFIVSKGPMHAKYELADNMWGQQSVPQIQVLPVVDLVITHGGNNTVSETFFSGKPMIVMPLWYDQFDNAERIQEKGFGLRLDPYLCSIQELLDAIECLVNDNELILNMKNISKRIQTENSIEELPKLIENMVNIEQ